MTIDLCFCKHLMLSGVSEARRHGITEAFLFDQGKTVFVYMRGFVQQFGKMPDETTVFSDTGIQLAGIAIPEPIEYYVVKIRERHLRNYLAERAKDIVKHMTTGDTDAVVVTFREALKTSQEITASGGASLIDLTDDPLRRYDTYLEKLNTKATKSIDSPWLPLDRMTGGFRPGELWAVVARTKTGKSWIAVLLCQHAWHNGHRVLLVSMENPTDMMTDRFDAVNAKLPSSDFRHATLGIHGEQKLVDSLHAMTNTEKVFVAGNDLIRTPTDIDIIVREHRIDFVLIDGVYLMHPSSGKPKSKYEQVSMVADELQKMPHRLGIPLLFTTQFNREQREGALSGSANKIGYAYELVQNAHGVLAMFTNNDLRASNRMILELMENREGSTGAMMVEWDLDRMLFDYIGPVDEDDLKKYQGGGKKKRSGGRKSSGNDGAIAF